MMNRCTILNWLKKKKNIKCIFIINTKSVVNKKKNIYKYK